MDVVTLSVSATDAAFAGSPGKLVMVTLNLHRPPPGAGVFPDDVHGWVYRVLEPSVPAADYHRRGQAAFTWRFHADRRLLSVTFLAAELGHTFWQNVRRQPEIRLGPFRTEIVDGQLRVVDPPGPPTARHSGADSTRLRMEFLTPVAFKQGRSVLPMPVPPLVFSSLARTWQRFFGQLEGWDGEKVYTNVRLAQFRGGTQAWRLRKTTLPGFVGRCEFEVVGPDLAFARAVSLLVAAAPFTGVGYKVGFGMGQVAVPAG